MQSLYCGKQAYHDPLKCLLAMLSKESNLHIHHICAAHYVNSVDHFHIVHHVHIIHHVHIVHHLHTVHHVFNVHNANQVHVSILKCVQANTLLWYKKSFTNS